MSELQQKLNNNLSQQERQKLSLEIAVQQEQQRFDKERQYLGACLKEKIDKITQLEVMMDEVRDQRRAIEQSLGPEVRSLKERITLLERNNEALNDMYQEQFTENSQSRININLLEKTLQRKEENLAKLESKSRRLNEKNHILKENLAILRE